MPPKSPRKGLSCPKKAHIIKGKDGRNEKILELYHNSLKSSFTEISRQAQKEFGISVSRKTVSRVIKQFSSDELPEDFSESSPLSVDDPVQPSSPILPVEVSPASEPPVTPKSSNKVGRPSKITQKLKNSIKCIILREPFINTSALSRELCKLEPGLKMSFGTVQRAKEYALAELSEEQPNLVFKRKTLDPEVRTSLRAKFRKIEEEAVTSAPENEPEVVILPEAEDSYICEEISNEGDENEAPSMALRYPLYANNETERDCNFAGEETVNRDLTEEKEEEDVIEGLPSGSRHDGHAEDERSSSSTHVIDERPAGPETRDDAKTSEFVRLESMLSDLTKSVAFLHTKFDTVQKILTEHISQQSSATKPIAVSLATDSSHSSASKTADAECSPRSAACDTTENSCVQLQAVDTSQPSNDVSVRLTADNAHVLCHTSDFPSVENKWSHDESECTVETCPQQCALSLLEKMVGCDALAKCSLSGQNNTKTIDEDILAKVKHEIITKFTANKTEKEQEQTWASCLQCIAQYCEDLRAKRSTSDASVSDMPVIVQVHGSSTREEGDSHHTRDLQELVENPGQKDNDEGGLVHVGGHPEITLTVAEYRQVSRIRLPNQFSIALADKLYGVETLEKSTLTGYGSSPVLDFDILTAIKDEVLERFGADKSASEKRSLWQQCQASISHRKSVINRRKRATCKRDGTCSDSHGSPQGFSTAPGSSSSCDDVTKMKPSDWAMLESFERSTDEGSNSSVPSGFTRDIVAIGGNSTVTLTFEDFEEASRKVQPTLFATALSDKIFGPDVLKISTLTGKDKTNKLDARVIDAIKSEVLSRFVPDVSPEEKEKVWVQCQQSIANRCKTLRFKEKSAVFQASLRNQLPTMVGRDLGMTYSSPVRSSSSTAVIVEDNRDEADENEDLEDVMIGDDPNVTMSLADYKQVTLQKQPRAYVLALAEKLFGRDMLAEATVDGRNNTPKLDLDILYAMKADVIERFAAEESPAEQESLWSDCLLCVATKCRTLRYRADKPANPTTSKTTPVDTIAIDVDSDTEPYSIIVGNEPGITLTNAQYAEVCSITRADKFAVALAEMLFGTEALATTKVVNVPYRSELDSKILRAIRAELINHFGKGMTSNEQEKLWSDCFISISLKCRTLRYARYKNVGSDCDTLSHSAEETTSRHAVLTGNDRSPCASSSRGSVDAVSPGRLAGSVNESRRVVIGKDVSITLPRFKHTNPSKTANPNKYTIALAEHVFGKETLARSTVTGHGRTAKLDTRLLNAIKAEIISIFGAHKSLAEQEQMWSSCLQSIAAKCKTLRYVKRHLPSSDDAGEMRYDRFFESVEDNGDVVVVIPDQQQEIYEHSWSPPSESPPTVLIGGSHDVTLPLDEFREVTQETEPSRYALALSSRLFTTDNPNELLDKAGIKGIQENILKAIKADVLGRFAAEKAPEERESIWRACMSAIMAQRGLSKS